MSRKYATVILYCKICGAPDGTRVWRSKNRPGIWTDEYDLPEMFPSEWYSQNTICAVSASGLCQSCRNRRAAA